MAHLLGERLKVVSGDPRETAFLFQSVCDFIQRANAITVHDTFVIEESDDYRCYNSNSTFCYGFPIPLLMFIFSENEIPGWKVEKKLNWKFFCR